MRGELTAQQASAQLGGLMTVLAAGVVGGTMSSAAAMAARREQRAVYDYAAALEAAQAHAADMEEVALSAMTEIARLEAEVARLTAACQQRQAHIEMMKGRVYA